MSKFVPINLLRVQSALTSDELVLLNRMRVIATVMTIVVFVIGLGVAATYVGTMVRLRSLDAQKTTTLRQISENAQKEILLTNIKDRIPSVEKIIAVQYPWKSLLEIIISIVSPPKLRAVRIDQSNILQLSIKTDSIDDMQQITAKIIELSNQKKLKRPQIDSLQIGREGIESVVSVYPL